MSADGRGTRPRRIAGGAVPAGFRAGIEPRDRTVASRVAASMMAVAACVTGLFAAIYPPPGAPAVAVGFAVPALLLAFAVGVRRVSGGGPSALWAAAPLVGVLLVAALDLATADPSAAGQVFFCFPVLYAASQLRPVGAYGVLLVAIGADAVVSFSLLPPQRALTDLVYVGVTLVTMTVLLVGAGQRQESLTTELRRRAATDPLTGLVTRRVLDEAAQTALASASGDGGTVLILADVDHFKAVNDRYGHPVGDDALVHVAGILSAHSRPEDVVSRLGGDEIALLLPGCSAALGIERAEAIAAAVRETPLATADGPIRISVSVGVAHVPGDAVDLRTLYTQADAVLYDAKRNGRGRVGRPVPGRVPSLSASSREPPGDRPRWSVD